MPDGKKNWSKPVLKKITPAEAIDLLMVSVSQETLSLRREVAELTQNLAACRDMLAQCQSKLGASDSPPPTAASNANGDYRPPYQEGESSRQTKRKGHKN